MALFLYFFLLFIFPSSAPCSFITVFCIFPVIWHSRKDCFSSSCCSHNFWFISLLVFLADIHYTRAYSQFFIPSITNAYLEKSLALFSTTRYPVSEVFIVKPQFVYSCTSRNTSFMSTPSSKESHNCPQNAVNIPGLLRERRNHSSLRHVVEVNFSRDQLNMPSNMS